MKTSCLALVVAFALSPVAAAAQQAPSAATPPEATGAVSPPIPAPAPGFVQPKTPWGDPDLQGFWPSVEMVGVPLQRPARFGTRNVLTDAEFAQRGIDIKSEEESLVAEIDVFTADVTTPCAIRCPTSPQPHWQETGKPSRQASLIIDPPDGRQPPLSQEGQARQARQQADNKARAARLQGREADSHLDRSLYDRCVTRGVIGSILPVIYNNGNEIFQAPGYVAIQNEMIHEARIVPLDGRPHADPAIRMWIGDSRGHWEGDTLVVKTKNFTDKTASFSPNGMVALGTGTTLNLTERFRRADQNTLLYEFTVEDPTTFTKPFTAVLPMRRSDELVYEYACHEGNYGLLSILSGTRAEDRTAK